MIKTLMTFLTAKYRVPENTYALIVDEHFVPMRGIDLQTYIACGDVAGVHHLIRYEWAVKVIADLQPMDILDVACGSGYGTYLIAQRFPRSRVLGVDYDPAAVSQAQASYSLPNLTYKAGDVTRWDETIGTGFFDCITSFDTLEHVSHREIMMESLVAHLRQEGSLLFSTPCASPVNALQPEWEHHKLEYSTSSLYDFLRRYFGVILRPDGLGFPHGDVFERLVGSGISYVLRMNPIICRSPIIVDNPYK